MFRLLSKNKGCDRNAIAFCSLFVAVLCLASRVFPQRNERYVRVMSSAGAQRRRYERRKKVGERKRERERERGNFRGESVGICVAICRSAGRVKEVWKSVSRERTPGEKLPASRKFSGCFTFGRAQHRRRHLFKKFAPC